MDRVECVVAGAGVVGLAVARALALAGRQVLVLEEQVRFGTGISSRNSEVVHSGIYYPTASLKARLCVAGRRLLADYCARRGIDLRMIGKLIVASGDAELAQLERLLQRAQANGVEEIERLGAAQAIALEPALKADAALRCGCCGIVDSHALMLAMVADIEDRGGQLACASPLRKAQRDGDAGWRLEVDTGTARFELGTRLLVNAAGLQAQQLASAIEGLPASRIPPRVLARGCYFALSGKAPFRRLIYPLPADGGLGVHLTLDLQQQARFGPDVEWIDAIDYTVDVRRADAFYEAIRRYWPGLPDGALRPAFAGIRPKLSGPGQAPRDFMIEGPAEHGVAGLINLFGIESPGLTSSLAIGDHVAALARDTVY